METQEIPVRDQSAYAEKESGIAESRIIEAEQTETAVLESLMEIRYA